MGVPRPGARDRDEWKKITDVHVFLTTEPVQSAALPLKRVHDVERGDRLALGVFGVGDGVADDAFEEGLEHAAGFFVYH